MSNQSDNQPTPTTLVLDPHQAARDLGKCLRETTEFQSYILALQAVNGDLDIQKLATQMRGHRNAVRWNTGDTTSHSVELERLEQELETLAVYQRFRQAENEVRTLFQAVDRLISQTAGVLFSSHAQRSRGCCG